MKTARTILWILFPVSLILLIAATYFRWAITPRVGNYLLMGTLLLPVTAMALQTFENRAKNLSKNYFIIKIAFELYLYLMIVIMFILTMRRV